MEKLAQRRFFLDFYDNLSYIYDKLS